MSSLPRGLYELILTHLLAERLTKADAGASGEPQYIDLRNAEAADRIALHLSSVVTRAIESFPENERALLGTQLAIRLVDLLASESTDALAVEKPVQPAKLLQAICGRLPDGRPAQTTAPLIPLLDTALLTNAPGEPRVGHQIQAEIESADAIDVVIAFVRRSGIQPLVEHLRRHCEAGKPLRVLTTVYTGSTEAAALERLQSLGANIRVSYDTTSTRLHAKAWIFHRESGFSTAYIGSSNLTHSAQITGLEWNVRVSAARNRPVVEKMGAVFDSYWELPEFEPFSSERFTEATAQERTPAIRLALSPIEIRLEPFQERLLEQIDVARQQGWHRNLLVSATGTGKTVMAAVDYARLKTKLARARLLFVAHRLEILEQSRWTFAHALRDANFGELWVQGRRPERFEHVFASIQSLGAAGVDGIPADQFDIVIVDEFHHAAAPTYDRLLQHLRPRELLGLTATPERADGQSVLHWFDDRIAAELRLWDAIDQHRLTPFGYYGIADELDLRSIPWRRGTGYDVDALTQMITSTEAWANHVLHEVQQHVTSIENVRAIGFCVSVAHAKYMAAAFSRNGVKCVWVCGETPAEERGAALSDLEARRINFVFSVDLFNEGVDVPSVDTLLLLRPSDSPVLFLQQLGRGLRKQEGKVLCTVLDFVGMHRKEFRFDHRLRALLGGTRKSIIEQVERGFPFLPAGCHLELDRISKDRVLLNLKDAIPSVWREKVRELQSAAERNPAITLRDFLEESGFELTDVFGDAAGRSWSDMREQAGLALSGRGPQEESLRRASARLLHVDDPERLKAWSNWLKRHEPPDFGALPVRERRLLLMLLVQLGNGISTRGTTPQEMLKTLWAHSQFRSDLLELFDVLALQVDHLSLPVGALPDVPLQVHARYTRQEVLSACGVNEAVAELAWREGVRFAKEVNTDLFVFTLDKTNGQFSPTTRYRDYALSRELIHWESQSGTRADSPTGRRYQNHVAEGSYVFLFCRVSQDDRAFYYLGPATYVSHRGELPMEITWKLQHPLPGDLFQSFAAAVA